MNEGQILNIAQSLFFEKGYEETSLDDIAAEAKVDSNQLKERYSTKADLLLDVLSEDFIDELEEQDNQLTEKDLDRKPAEIVYDYLYKRLHPYLQLSKAMYRDLTSLALRAYESDPEQLKKFVGLDFMLVDELIGFLNQMKEMGVLSADFDSNEAAEIIYSVLAFEFVVFLSQGERSVEDCMAGVQRKVRFLF
ncbi:TetR/AcrR family transcriptional regulator [Halobacillus salinus]|nr:TetR/AcrR family transcriptional regulator [Halobacillus salinus]